LFDVYSISMEQIKYEEFNKVYMMVGEVISVSELEKSEKLLKLEVDFGLSGVKQILSGIKQWYKPGYLLHKQFVFVVNIEPRKMMGLESQGMILAVDSDERPILLIPLENAKNGSVIR